MSITCIECKINFDSEEDTLKCSKCQKYRICKKCNKHASYGKSGTTKWDYCFIHAPIGYVSKRKKNCIEQKCNKLALYGDEKTKIPNYCKEHKPINYINLICPTCKLCNKRPTYGIKGGKAEYCKEHKPVGFVNIAQAKCKLCEKRPNFGKPGTRKPEYCKKHKPDNYINVRHKKCIHLNCNKLASCGKENSKVIEYCKEHALSEYKNIISKRCIYPNCTTYPSFGKIGSTNKEYCKKHKPNNYVNLGKYKKCIHLNCDKRANYGKIDTKIPEFCIEHKPDNYVDIKNKKCVFPDCDLRRNFNYPGYSPEYCSKHKKERMIINPTKFSKEEDKICDFCSTIIHYNEIYCSGCKKYLDLNQTTVKTHEKEIRIKELFNENKINFIHDSIVTCGCSKRRPDFLINTNWGNIIIEVDEFQHKRKSYSCECEITRMKQIYYDVGSSNLLFIRYNPDNYKPSEEYKEIAPIFREKLLIKIIQNYIQKQPKNNLSVLYLFYDGFMEDIIEEEKIDVL